MTQQTTFIVFEKKSEKGKKEDAHFSPPQKNGVKAGFGVACDECSVGGNPSAASRLRKWDRPLRMKGGGGGGRNWMLRDKSNSHKRLHLTVKRERKRGRGRLCKSLEAVSHLEEYQRYIHHEISQTSSVQ